MSKSKKFEGSAIQVQYSDYQDYLNSDKWKQVKEDFFNNVKLGYSNCCEVTGDSYDGEEKKNLHLHHFRYCKNWNDDVWTNLVFISKEVHDYIHDKNNCFEPSEDDLAYRERYLCALKSAYIEHIKITYSNEYEIIKLKDNLKEWKDAYDKLNEINSYKTDIIKNLNKLILILEKKDSDNGKK